jgi:HAD superfamily hydrolase (TIGR01509 family)
MGGSELLCTLLGSDKPAISKAHGRYFTELHGFIRPLPGASDLLRRVAGEGRRVVIVTSSKKRDIPALLGALGCDEVIDDVVHGEMAPRSKPAPDLFGLALERIGAEPDEVLALGDTVWDVQAAKKAGIDCVAVGTGGTDLSRLKKAGALAVYAGCEEILASWDTTPFASVPEKRGAGDHSRGRRPQAGPSGAQKRLVS